jgi:hypothetical protein
MKQGLAWSLLTIPRAIPGYHSIAKEHSNAQTT